MDGMGVRRRIGRVVCAFDIVVGGIAVVKPIQENKIDVLVTPVRRRRKCGLGDGGEGKCEGEVEGFHGSKATVSVWVTTPPLFSVDSPVAHPAIDANPRASPVANKTTRTNHFIDSQ